MFYPQRDTYLFRFIIIVAKTNIISCLMVVFEISKTAVFANYISCLLCLFVVLETSKPGDKVSVNRKDLCLFVVPETSKPSNSIYLYIFYNLYSLSISMIITPCFNIYILRFTAWSQLTLFF